MTDERNPLEIRKYPNRRYYDTSSSSHVTLDEIRARIKDGSDVRITDSRSGEDITARVLAQIILEYDSPKLLHFPTPILTHMIRGSDSVVEDFVQNYLTRAFELFQATHRQWEEAASSALPPSPMTAWAKTMMSWMPPVPGGPLQPENEPAKDGALRSRIHDLERQLEALKSEIRTEDK